MFIWRICKFKTSNKNKKIYDPFQTFKSLNNNFILKYNPDIFLHTWNTKYNDKLIKLINQKNLLLKIKKILC